MVSSYNSLQATIADEIRFSADINTRGGLASDPVARGFLYQMRRMTTETITTYNGNNVSLSSVGIRTNADGTLTINEAALAFAFIDLPFKEESHGFRSGEGRGVEIKAASNMTIFLKEI
jgi:flagellar hook-associated protein 2